MSSTAEELKKFLPYYIPAKRENGFLVELEKFPNPPSPFYLQIPDPEPLQGDIWNGFEMVRVDGVKIPTAGIVVSNSCDLAQANQRLTPLTLAFAPVVSLEKYQKLLLSGGVSPQKIDAHLKDVRAQRVTNMFFLPGNSAGLEERVAMLDRVQSTSREKFDGQRLLSLADVAFYLYIFKLSIHFCRLHEAVDRTPAEVDADTAAVH